MKSAFRISCAVVCFVVLLLHATLVSANPTQEDVFKSISDNMGKKTDSSHFLAGMAAITAVAIMVGLFSKRKQRVVQPEALNHPGKLMKEVVRATSLRPVEVRYLKTLAERQSIASPMTLLLCPSVLLRAAKNSTSKAEKKVFVQLTRKLGIATHVQQVRQKQGEIRTSAAQSTSGGVGPPLSRKS